MTDFAVGQVWETRSGLLWRVVEVRADGLAVLMQGRKSRLRKLLARPPDKWALLESQ